MEAYAIVPHSTPLPADLALPIPPVQEQTSPDPCHQVHLQAYLPPLLDPPPVLDCGGPVEVLWQRPRPTLVRILPVHMDHRDVGLRGQQ